MPFHLENTKNEKIYILKKNITGKHNYLSMPQRHNATTPQHSNTSLHFQDKWKEINIIKGNVALKSVSQLDVSSSNVESPHLIN